MFGYSKNGGITSIVVIVSLVLKEGVRKGQWVWGFSDTDF